VGVEIDGQDNRGWTALINVSCSDAQSSIVELLLALGADVNFNLFANDGRTACHYAADVPTWAKSVLLLCALVAAGGDLGQPNKEDETSRMIATRDNVALPTADEIAAARRRIAKARLDLVRERAFQICVGLQSFRLDALQLCEILMHSFWCASGADGGERRSHSSSAPSPRATRSSCSFEVLDGARQVPLVNQLHLVGVAIAGVHDGNGLVHGHAERLQRDRDRGEALTQSRPVEVVRQLVKHLTSRLYRSAQNWRSGALVNFRCAGAR
jgi:hypothetical protein